MKQEELIEIRLMHARAIVQAGGLEAALASGILPKKIDTTLSELIVLGLLRQNVHKFLCVFGHGSTELGEVLRVYQTAGLVKVYNVRNEIEASHAAMALRWVTGEKAAVITSIGPGALQALAASLSPASDGVGVWYLFGDETTEDEGPNMQQIPALNRQDEQGLYLKLCATMGHAYSLHTPLAVATALRRGLNTVDHPHRGGPFYLLMPMNTQPAHLPGFNLDELPGGAPPALGAAGNDQAYHQACEALQNAQRVVIKVGGGARGCAPVLLEFLELANAVAVTSPLVSGVIPYDHPRNMTVGGSKGSICGNYAMDNADVLVAIGSRFVCQSDCSRTGYPQVNCVININTDMETATHYGRTIALVGDAAPTLRKLDAILMEHAAKPQTNPSTWIEACTLQRQAWEAHKAKRYQQPVLYDDVWNELVLTQPGAIKIATDWARHHDVISFFDAGDVQANGFQIVEDDRLGRTFTETGATYMGFAASALLATGIADKTFYGMAVSGDGSFTMNPQILIDGVEHGAQGCILLLDNRRMGAISGLQIAQYGTDFATNDAVKVDYIAWANSVAGVQGLDGGRSPGELLMALEQARTYKGISLIHVPVYFGPHELGSMGVFGRWNVGNWVGATQALRHEIGL